MIGNIRAIAVIIGLVTIPTFGLSDQGAEFAAGAVNLSLMGFYIRDGLRLMGRRNGAAQPTTIT